MKKVPRELAMHARQRGTNAYQDHVPASVPQALVSDSESVWALFEQSILDTEERVALAAELSAAKARDDAMAQPNRTTDTAMGDNGFPDTNFDATDFAELPYDATVPSALKPEGT